MLLSLQCLAEDDDGLQFRNLHRSKCSGVTNAPAVCAQIQRQQELCMASALLGRCPRWDLLVQATGYPRGLPGRNTYDFHPILVQGPLKLLFLGNADF